MSSSCRAGCTAWTRPTAKARAPTCSRPSSSRPPPIATTATYSGGMKRRLDVGLGIVHRPAVLFLDEPTTGLDPQARARMWDEIRALREKRHDRLPDDPLSRGGRRARRPSRDHRPRPDRGRGHADELKRQVAGDVVTLGVNGATESVLETVRHAAVRPRGQHRGRCRAPLRRRGRDRRPAAPPRCSTARVSRRHRSPSHRPSLDDVFLRQTGRSLREDGMTAA